MPRSSSTRPKIPTGFGRRCSSASARTSRRYFSRRRRGAIWRSRSRVGRARPELRRRTPGVRRLTALLLGQEARHVLEEPPRHVGILLRERPEVPELDRVAAHRCERLNGRRALGFADHPELAEVVAGAHRADPFAVDDDGGLALGDHEEGDPAHLSLLGELRARRNGTVPEVLREPAELAVTETAEQRNPLEILGDARHAATLSEARGASADQRLMDGRPSKDWTGAPGTGSIARADRNHRSLSTWKEPPCSLSVSAGTPSRW